MSKHIKLSKRWSITARLENTYLRDKPADRGYWFRSIHVVFIPTPHCSVAWSSRGNKSMRFGFAWLCFSLELWWERMDGIVF